MKKTDLKLGMQRPITRRDFIHNTSLASLGLLLSTGCQPGADSKIRVPSEADYPPIGTGLRGSHPGSFEAAHAFARDGVPFEDPVDLDETFDLVVVGGGISGLTAAYQYRKKFGEEAPYTGKGYFLNAMEGFLNDLGYSVKESIGTDVDYFPHGKEAREAGRNVISADPQMPEDFDKLRDRKFNLITINNICDML